MAVASTTQIGSRLDWQMTRFSRFFASCILFALLIFSSFSWMPWMLNQDNCARPFGSKLQDFIGSWSTPDVVVLGSSLTLVPAARCDDEFHHIRSRTDPWWYDDIVTNYSRADYLQDLLNHETKQSLVVANLSLSGAMVSDDLFVLHQIKRKDWQPKFVICCLAPRDFVCTDSGSGPNSFFFRLWTQLRHAYPEIALLKTKVLAKPALALAQWHERWDVRRKNARVAFAALYSHCTEGKLFQPLIGIVDGQFAPSYEPRVNVLADRETYKDRYNPPNFALCKEQIGYLSALLKYCGDEHIGVAVVNMPLPQENLVLLEPKLLEMYKAGLRESCKHARVPLLDMQVGNYSLADFEDACHLNAVGGKRVFQQLARRLAPAVSEQNKVCQLAGGNVK
jgi:hypothetical protein